MSNPRAERVLAVARLAQRPARRRSGAFLAEGPQAVREAVAVRGTAPGATGPVRGRVRELFATAAAAARHPELLDAASSSGAVVRWCTDEVLAVMADTATPQGLLAVCDLVGTDLASALSASAPSASAGPPGLVAVLSRVRDPGNAGTVLRAADAAGAGAVLLTAGSVDVHNPKCVRATAGSLFHLDVVEEVALADAVPALRAAGFSVLAADGAPRPGVADLDDLLDDAARGCGVLAGPVAWVFGNEASGLAPGERDLADLVVRVPLHGRAESLNLATAAAVCLYASARGQRRRAPGGTGGAFVTQAAVQTGRVSDPAPHAPGTGGPR